jgi:urease accessory protein
MYMPSRTASPGASHLEPQASCDRSVQSAAPPGYGRIEVARSGARSVVRRAFAISPLRLLTPGNHGHGAWVYTSSFGGGLVDGDRMSLNVDVKRGATAFISTQAATKAYRSPRGTSAELIGRVEVDGLLVVMPDPVMCFAGARYRQIQRFLIANGASLVIVDCLLSGRLAAGERWAFDCYHSLLQVRVGDRLLVHDSLVLYASDGELARRFRRFEALAVAVIIGPSFADEAANLVAAASSQEVVPRPDLLMTASNLRGVGCIVRVAGVSAEQVGRTLRELLRFVAARLGDDPWIRKW